MYSIRRDGKRWYVLFGWEIVFSADNKTECTEWIAAGGLQGRIS